MDSVWFVFLFLPSIIFINYILPVRFRSIILTFSSVAFLLLIQPSMLPLILIFAAVDYILGILTDSTSSNFAKNCFLTLSVLFNIGVFILSQYIADFPVVLGVSVISLVKISYLADIKSGKAKAEKNVFSYLSAVLCFPCFHYGPILNFSNVSYMMKAGRPSLTSFGSGASLFIYGLFKKVIISDMLFTMLGKIYLSSNTVVGAWIWIVFSVLAFYYMLLGYSQMAQGICKMLGFKINQNFSFPFMSASVTSFFRRFNIGLAEFVKKYVYIGLGGNRHGTVCLVFAVTVSSLVTTLWYGLSMNKVVAALFFALVIIVEKTMFEGLHSKFAKVICAILAYASLFVGFTLFLTSSATEATLLLKCAFGIDSAGLYDNNVFSCISSYLPIMALAVLLIFNFSKMLNRAIQKKKSVFLNIIFVLFNLSVLFVCTAYIV